MLLRYWRLPFHPAQLPKLLKTEAHGTVFSHLRYLKALGVSVTVEESSIEKLSGYLQKGLPCIVAVETGELRSYWQEATSHAVVVVGIENNVVYLNDPAFDAAPQPVSLAEFELAWMEQDYRCSVIKL